MLCEEEYQSIFVKPEVSNVNTINVSSSSNRFIDFNRFSNYQRLLRSLFYVLRFCKLSSNAFNFNEVEILLLRITQQQMFTNEYDLLKANKTINNNSRLSELRPFLDKDGLLRCRGRIQSSSLSYDIKHPIILDNKHKLTHLIIKFYHESNLHADPTTLTNLLRQRFWVIQCRRSCKAVINSCMKCKRAHSKLSSVDFDSLPPERVTSSSIMPFENTGLDYLGPIAILNNNQKLYILLLTCLHTRAIHLVCTTSLNLPDFLNALSRFISRRGCPRVIRSDNAKTFQAAAERLGLKHQIEWKFHVERAPWTGGVWERLVTSVKAALKTSLSKYNLRYQEIETLTCQIEHILNERPITFCTGNDFLKYG